MFQVVNNKIFITRGQSAVYSREVRRNDNKKSPYIIYDGSDRDSDGNITSFRRPKLYFIVKRNIYSKEKTLFYSAEIIPNTVKEAYVGEGDAFSKTWLKDKSGNVIEPKENELFIVLSEGSYLKNIFRFDGSVYVRDFSFIPIFDSQNIVDYKEGNMPENGILYRKITTNGIPYYQYYDEVGSEWKDYQFTINVTIPSEATMNVNPGTYYYEISVVYTNLDGTISYKDILLEPTEFIIGGTNSD